MVRLERKAEASLRVDSQDQQEAGGGVIMLVRVQKLAIIIQS